ncbi:lmo0801 family class 1 internalin [Listeria monocytogenes]|uniref:lmo0801 family class 1 internalin n=1 Tax=Listeria monocytogenes TaxID=1639 RepID=UPI000D73C5D7|nr:lmo0801 family class 1 internalin [Listeria monocytogenes]PXE60753.1 lmo0801 family class 1 internalin [Listeria monocytogenes]
MKKLCTVILFLTLLLNGFVPNAHAKTESPSADNNLQVAPPAAIKDVFPDPAMANEVLKSLNLKKLNKKSTSDTVTQTELNSLTGSFQAINKGIKSIEGVEYLQNITELDVEKNQITDIAPVANLKKLTTLLINTNQITDISPVADLANLTTFYCGNNPINDISAVQNLTKLSIFNCYTANVEDISPVKNLVNLKTLSLGSNNIHDISDIEKLTALEYLSFSNNPVENPEVIGNLTNLNTLWLYNAQIRNIDFTANLPKLKSVYLYNNQISNISEVSNWANIEYLELNNNQITDITPVANLTTLKTLKLNDQIITNREIPFQKNISIENKVMDNFGNIVTPNNISDNGTYNSPTLSWNLNEIKDNLSYDFTTKITILNINATYSGTVIQPLTKDSTRPIITADEKVSYPEGTTKTTTEFLTDIHATTDDGSPIEVDLNAVDFGTAAAGSYTVTLTAVDTAGNEATPVDVTIIITSVDTSKPVITADEKVSYPDGTTKTAAEFLTDIHATTDDGSPIEVDLNAVAVDTAGNEAAPIQVTIIITNSKKIDPIIPVEPGGNDVKPEKPNEIIILPKDSEIPLSIIPKDNIEKTNSINVIKMIETNEIKNKMLPKTGDKLPLTVFLGMLITLAGISYLRK